jgi:hypothetical protein
LTVLTRLSVLTRSLTVLTVLTRSLTWHSAVFAFAALAFAALTLSAFPFTTSHIPALVTESAFAASTTFAASTALAPMTAIHLASSPSVVATVVTTLLHFVFASLESSFHLFGLTAISLLLESANPQLHVLTATLTTTHLVTEIGTERGVVEIVREIGRTLVLGRLTAVESVVSPELSVRRHSGGIAAKLATREMLVPEVRAIDCANCDGKGRVNPNRSARTVPAVTLVSRHGDLFATWSGAFEMSFRFQIQKSPTSIVA